MIYKKTKKIGEIKIVNILIADALRSEKGIKRFTRDFIGAGPRLISGILEYYGINSKIVFPENLKKNELSEYDFLFISAMTMDLLAVKKVITIWKSISNKPILIGGPITSNPKDLQNLEFDIAFIGESEETLEKLIEYGIKDANLPDHATLKTIDGIFYKKNHKIIINEPLSYISKEKLNKYQPSTKRIIDYPYYFISRVYIECVRGCSNFFRPKIKLSNNLQCNNCGKCQKDLNSKLTCPQNIPPGCGFCSVPSIYGPSRSKYVSNIINEINGLISKGVRRFVLGGADFLDYERDELVKPNPLTDPYYPPPNKKKIEELLLKISSIPEVKNNKVFISIENIKACLFSREIASIISKYLSNTSISIGCESGSTEYLKSIGKPSSVEDVIKTIQICKEFDIRTHCYFIHGLPDQKISVLRETKKLMEKLNEIGIEKITIYKFKPIPKSAFEKFSYHKSNLSEKIKNTAIKINFNQKLKLLNKNLRVFIAEPNKYNLNDGIGYVLEGGPTVLIKHGGNLIGKELTVKIINVISDKMVEGKIIV